MGFCEDILMDNTCRTNWISTFPKDHKQNYYFCRLKLVVESLFKFGTNKLKLIKVPKFFANEYKISSYITLVTNVIDSPMSTFPLV